MTSCYFTNFGKIHEKDKPMTHDEIIEIVKAHKEGKKIEVAGIYSNNFSPSEMHYAYFDFQCCQYRIAKPKKVKMWQWVYLSGKRPVLSVSFYQNERDASSFCENMLCRADWTEIEVDTEDLK